MNWTTLKAKIAPYYPALLLNDVLPQSFRLRLSRILAVAVQIALAVSIVAILAIKVPNVPSAYADAVRNYIPQIYGTLEVFLGLWLLILLLNTFYYAYYFRAEQSLIPERGSKRTTEVDFETASIIYDLNSRDATRGFLRSHMGERVMARSGVARQEVRAFLREQRVPLVAIDLMLPEGVEPTAPLLAGLIYDKDEAFAGFLARFGVSRRDFIGAVEWIAEIARMLRKEERWWGRDKLGRIPGIGKEWAYGATYTLQKYATDIEYASGARTLIGSAPTLHSDADELEGVLARSREANALLVGEEGGLRMEVIFELANRIRKGTALPPLEHKRIFLFEGASFISTHESKEQFERAFLGMCYEALAAGNVILVIGDFPQFLASAKTLGADALSLLEPFLSTSHFQIVAVASVEEFHQELSKSEKCMRFFEKVSVHELDADSLLRLVEGEVIRAEARSRLFFTYPAIRAIAESTESFFSNGVGADKASDLLAELLPYMERQGKRVVTRDAVLGLVAQKTGIPLGEVSEEEKQKLLTLEEDLSKRIVGQKEAVSVISHAMRRARSGVGNPKRPMGSFLFLGPTGVGKTETTKALAEVFFGGEGDITRLDMSEYKTADALPRLIGSFESKTPGILSSKLREKPYGVLLLDEFEKTSKEVLDLFLQILDEGFFSDMAGKRVNARNLIIVATSNAGSDLIFEMAGKGVLDKDTIVNEIIARGIYKPELLNRFDGVVLFHPLGKEELRSIASLMLAKLDKRLREKGIQLVITDALIERLLAEGSDPKFGARPMNRAIQEKVEQVIARKMLEGAVKAGSRVELTEADLA